MSNNWFPFHYRDVKAWHCEGLTLTTTSDLGAKYLDAAVAQLVLRDHDPHIGGYEKALNLALEADPDLVMAQVIKLSLDAMGKNYVMYIKYQI